MLSPAITSYTDELPVYFTPANTNTTTTPTMQVNALGGHVIVKAGGALAAGDIVAGVPCFLLYSLTNTNWVLMNPQTVVGASPWTFGTGTDSAIGGDGTSTATGTGAVSYGSGNTAAGNFAVAFGSSNSATGNYSFTAGISCTANGVDSISMGVGCSSNGLESVTLGYGCLTRATHGWAIGNNAVSNNAGSFVWGDNSSASNQDTGANQWVITASGGFYIWYGTANLAANFLSTGCTLLGTNTNDSASAGYVGEFMSSVIPFASAVTLTSTATAYNVTSLALTAGDWDVWGNVFVNFSGTATEGSGWISGTSATLPDPSLRTTIATAAVGNFDSVASPVPQLRFSVPSGGETVYLSAYSQFTTGGATACGGIYARRVR